MRIRALVAVAALLTVAACGSDEPTSTKPTFGGPAPTFAPDELSGAKEAAGIEDCPAPGRPAADLPDVTLECLGGGRAVDLSALGGKPTVINLWASWCAPCRNEMPLLAKADEAYGDRVQFIGIDFKDAAPDDAIELARATGVTYPQLVDPEGTTVASLKVVNLPQTIFVDAQGRMVATERKEFRSYAELTAAIDDHLGVAP
ncbi:redoxin domain-containing protein [Aeromicrobium sp. SMF47]|uniref:Redoxin domain-containing protein n=1 Tax=Aeromicrobium yanjiei TaxID=2662028 RepID=A0A5Q2MAN1_9ACTN|nr:MULTISPECIES: TlpA disulfide reductase family protein [Aeromicrobium]MRJ75385.1 redoxin domain-containing protein [Aeromicrobium yanjiei]MRK02557.1 redoxin domain-containing protein [Aeromicrobium sp. S22]QGG40164.1 redoxin domain-containing protein [Aeromicrobium yanjiei]